MPKIHEHQIRDYILENLFLISPELSLVEKEFQIEPIDGSRAFIDILAVSGNKYVILEIKRSDQSARSATNEISKYVEGLKRKLSLNDDDIRVVLISTQWRELTIPFAYMADRLGIPCEGYLIEWNDNQIARIIRVETPKLLGMRLFSPAHGMYMYHNHDEFERGLKSVEEILSGRHIKDYVIIKLCAPPGHHEWVAATNRAQAAALGLSPSIFDGNDERLEFSLYITFLRKGIEFCRNLLTRDRFILEEIDLQISDAMSEDEVLLIHEHALWNLKPFPYSKCVEEAYTAKFAHTVLEVEGWQVMEIKRYGSLSENLILSDEDIIAEVRGDQGVVKGRLRSGAAIGNPAEMARLESEIFRCLGNDNIAWREQLLFVFRSLRCTGYYADCRVVMSITSPNNFLLSLYNQIRDPSNGYLPDFSLRVVGPGNQVQRLYVGRLVWTGVKPDFDKIVGKYFAGHVMQLVISTMWGGFLNNDAEILIDLGLSYETFFVNIDEPGSINRVEMLKDFVFTMSMNAFNSLQKMVDTHEEFLEVLVERMSRYIKGGFFMSSPLEHDFGHRG